MRFQLLSLLAALAPVALADFKFMSPLAGVTLQPAAVTITLADSGAAPAISLFTTYTLELVQGGQADASQRVIAELATAQPYATGLVINAVITPLSTITVTSLANSFFFKLTSFAADGGSVVNYSGRFDVAFTTPGPNPPNIVAAVAALNGATAGPGTQNKMNVGAAAGAPGAAQWSVPYPLQTGLTKWAPMQPIPGTKITVKNFTPLFPTSAVTIAKTWLPAPSIATTITQSQTFSVQSYENQAAPQSNPTGDMAKYLRRWQD